MEGIENAGTMSSRNFWSKLSLAECLDRLAQVAKILDAAHEGDQS